MSRVAKLGAFVISATVLLIAVVAPARADEIAEARQFVRTLADKAISQLTDPGMSEAQRAETFRKLLGQHFDVPAIGRLALGRYWRVATPQEQREYLDLFEDLIVATYANRFREYSGENLDIVNAVKTGDDGAVMVQSQIVRNVAKPIRVDWRVARIDGQPKIIDVVIEGVSMMQTQRSEFSSVITRGGGKVASLIAELRAKTKALGTRK